VPFQRNEHFVGREAQLKEIDAKLSSHLHYQRVAVVGLGGVGKTQLVLEFAYRKREACPECSIFWIPVVSSATFEQAYLQIGHLLEITEITGANADVKQLVKTALSQESSGQWLLILDNADDIDGLYKKAYGDNGSLALIDYLPSSRHGSIIFTTRTRKAAVKQAGRNVLSLYEMDQVEAKKVLEESLIRTEVLKEEDATIKLLELLACLPLAIVQAAAFINENEIPISSYIALYENDEDEVIELLSEEFEDQGRYRDKDMKNPIANTWFISFNQISVQDPLAAEYLSFMSCLLPQKIPMSLLPPAPSKIKMTSAIGTLTAYSFITKREADQSFDLHRLVHLATRNWLKTTKSLTGWTERTLLRLGDVLTEADYNSIAIWTTYLPHARHVLALPNLSDINKKAEDTLLYKFGRCLRRSGQYRDAEQIFRQLMEQDQRYLG
jgi:NB-ARC domain